MIKIIMKTTKQDYINFTENGIHYLQCRECRRYQNVGSKKVVSTLCSKCLNKKIPIENLSSEYVSTGRPRGWHWMAEFVDKDGKVYHRGKEISKLYGTLPPTKIKKVKTKKKKKKKNIQTADQKFYDHVAMYKEKKRTLKQK